MFFPESLKALALLGKACGESSPVAAALTEWLTDLTTVERLWEAEFGEPHSSESLVRVHARSLAGELPFPERSPEYIAAALKSTRALIRFMTTPAETAAEIALKALVVISIAQPQAMAVTRAVTMPPVPAGSLAAAETYSILHRDAERVAGSHRRRSPQHSTVFAARPLTDASV
jgi:hypothetical protein